MAAETLNIENISVSNQQVYGGTLLPSANRNEEVDKLVGNYQQKHHADLITAGSIKVTYRGIVLTDVQMENLRLTSEQFPRASDHPELLMLDVIGGAAVAAAGGDVKLVGSDFLQGQTFDGLTIGTGIDQLYFELMKPGESGQSLELLNTGSLSVAFAAGKWSIGYNFGTDTADVIANFVNAHATSKGVLRCVSGGVGTATPATAETPLAGGAGNYAENKVLVGGAEALPKHAASATPAATWGDALIEATTPANPAGGLAGDVVPLRIRSNGKNTDSLAATLV